MGRYRVAMDIGGTFTDVVTYDDSSGVFSAAKASTTPGDLSVGVLAGLDAVVGQARTPTPPSRSGTRWATASAASSTATSWTPRRPS